MSKNFKNIISLLFLFVFLLPGIIKLEHHHTDVNQSVSEGQSYRAYHEKCVICNFEFSVFITSARINENQKNILSERYINSYNSEFFNNTSQFSFLLRAPPAMYI
jgi:hypothetical protein